MAPDTTTAATQAPPPVPVPSAGPSVALPALFLAALAVAALLLARRRRVLAPTRLVEVLETASLGPRRSLVVARVQDELLVLGASEAGITLLSSRPAPPSLQRAAPPDDARFRSALAESVEDLELRRKLAGGSPGVVR